MGRDSLRTEERWEILYSIINKGKREVQVDINLIDVLWELNELVYEKYSEQSLGNRNAKQMLDATNVIIIDEKTMVIRIKYEVP